MADEDVDLTIRRFTEALTNGLLFLINAAMVEEVGETEHRVGSGVEFGAVVLEHRVVDGLDRAILAGCPFTKFVFIHIVVWGLEGEGELHERGLFL